MHVDFVNHRVEKQTEEEEMQVAAEQRTFLKTFNQSWCNNLYLIAFE